MANNEILHVIHGTFDACCVNNVLETPRMRLQSQKFFFCEWDTIVSVKLILAQTSLLSLSSFSNTVKKKRFIIAMSKWKSNQTLQPWYKLHPNNTSWLKLIIKVTVWTMTISKICFVKLLVVGLFMLKNTKTFHLWLIKRKCIVVYCPTA